MFGGFGLAWGLRKPKPAQAKPKPGLSGQAGPEQHYSRQPSVIDISDEEELEKEKPDDDDAAESSSLSSVKHLPFST